MFLGTKSSKGQASIDLIIVLAISLMALAIVYSLYAEQIQTVGISKESFSAKTAVQKIVDASNKLYIAGPGSSTVVYFEIPKNIKLADANVVGRTIAIKLSNDSFVTGTADANFHGTLRDRVGKQAVYLDYNGTNVIISYKDFELNKRNISFTAFPDTNNSDSIIVRNNHTSTATFFVQNSFSHGDIAFAASTSTFTLAPDQLQTIVFDFNIGSSAYGNYAGSTTIIGQIDDTNYSKKVNISAEVQLDLDDVIIYPLNQSFTAAQSATPTKAFSICNNTIKFTDLSWSAAGTAGGWVDAVPSFSDLNAYACRDFNLDFTIPGDAAGINAGTLTVDYNSTESYTSNISITIG
jgi:hypothetical protein